MSVDFDRFETASRRSTVFSSKGVVACSQPLAAEAGLSVLRAGGNAADAVVAMAAALNVTEPCNTGMGGDCFALFWDAKERRVRAINGSGRSAKALSLEKAQAMGITGQRIPYDNVNAVTVPGAVAGLVDIHKNWGSGKLSLSQVFEPAIGLAEDGFAVHQMASHEWREHEALLQQVAATSGPGYPFLINGKAPVPGQFFSNPDLAKTLRKIGAEGKKGFYEGPIAQAIVDAVQSRGGLLTLEDLAAHETDFVEPIKYTYKSGGRDETGYTIHECPPNGQGLAALIAFGILDVLQEEGVIDLQQTREGSAEWYHTLVEAIRLAFADAHAYVADPNFVHVPIAEILSKEYLRSRAKLFNKTTATAKYHQGRPVSTSDTVYLTAADSEGNAVSFIMSNYHGFGTAVVPEGWGFTLQNRGCAFSLDPTSPNVLQGGKRPYHTIIPAMVTRGNELYMSYGVMGGAMQPQGHVQVLLNMLHNQRSPQLALDAKRFCVGGTRTWSAKEPFYNTCVGIEHGVPEETIKKLEEMGHEIERIEGAQQCFFGKGQVILRTVDPVSGKRVWAAGTDYRGDGCALPQP